MSFKDPRVAFEKKHRDAHMQPDRHTQAQTLRIHTHTHKHIL